MEKNDKKEVDPTDATAQKNAGNAAFQAGNTEKAIEYYTKAIELDSKQAAYYSNRAQAYITLKAFKKALEDADSAITVDPNYARAYVRKAQCLMEKTDNPDFYFQGAALATCEAGLALECDQPIKDELNAIMALAKAEMAIEEQSRADPRYSNLIKFADWCNSSGILGYGQNVKARWIGPCDFTIFATRDIAQGEMIASIPLSLLAGNLNPFTIDNEQLPITKEIHDQLTKIQPLALENILSIWMLECVIYHEGLAHGPYFEMFHEPKASLPAGFEQEENKYLEGSNIKNEIASRLQFFYLEYDFLQNQFPHHFKKRTEEGKDCPEGAKQSFHFEMYYGHSLMIQRRSFAKEEDTPIGRKQLVPLMDLCQHSADNHNCETGAQIKDVEGQRALMGVQMVATRAIKRGEGITTNYGVLDGTTWFQKYGMVLPGNDQHNNVVQYFDLPKEPANLYEEKISYFPQNDSPGAISSASLTQRAFQLNQNLDYLQMRRAMSYIRFGLYDGAGFEPEWLETRIKYAAEYNAHHKYTHMAIESFPCVSYDNEQKMLSAFHGLAKEMIQAHPCSLEQGEAFLQENEENLKPIVANGVKYVQNEKRSLGAILEVTKYCLDLMQMKEKVSFVEIPEQLAHSGMYIRDILMPCIEKHWVDEKKKAEQPQEEEKNEAPTEVDVDAMMLD